MNAPLARNELKPGFDMLHKSEPNPFASAQCKATKLPCPDLDVCQCSNQPLPSLSLGTRTYESNAPLGAGGVALWAKTAAPAQAAQKLQAAGPARPDAGSVAYASAANSTAVSMAAPVFTSTAVACSSAVPNLNVTCKGGEVRRGTFGWKWEGEQQTPYAGRCKGSSSPAMRDQLQRSAPLPACPGWRALSARALAVCGAGSFSDMVARCRMLGRWCASRRCWRCSRSGSLCSAGSAR